MSMSPVSDDVSLPEGGGECEDRLLAGRLVRVRDPPPSGLAHFAPRVVATGADDRARNRRKRQKPEGMVCPSRLARFLPIG